MPEILQSTEHVLSILAVVGAELLLLLVLTACCFYIARLIFSYLAKRETLVQFESQLNDMWRWYRFGLLLLVCFLILLIILLNAWLVWQNQSPYIVLEQWISNISADIWLHLSLALGKILAAAVAIGFGLKYLHRFFTASQTRTEKFTHFQSNTSEIRRFFNSLSQVFTIAAWLFFIVFVTEQLALADSIYQLLIKAISIYLIIGLATIAARMVAVVVLALNSFMHQLASSKAWQAYFEALQPLLPLLQKSLAYIIWIAGLSLVIAQLTPIAEFAKLGPRLIQSIVIFFIARVIIDAGNLLIDHKQYEGDYDEMVMRRRATIMPLMKTIYQYVVYFVTLVLILGALGIDIMPFLAGAGILGVVIGFGAQPLINDIVSGFFILFENIFLVGDVIDTGQVLGAVEHIDFRTTKIRDPEGNLHILRNGDLNHIKNYSKDFTFAVVEVPFSYDVDVVEARSFLIDCGAQVQQAMADDVTDALEVKGIVAFEPSAMHFRVSMPVKPAKHFVVATKLREVIKQGFDAKGWRIPANQQQVHISGMP